MYKAENIDTDMFLEGIRAKRNAQHEKSIRKKIEADAYFSGYDQACFDIEGMFDCANYESPKVQSRTYRAGANDALYYLCKELNIPAEDLVNDWNTELPEIFKTLDARIAAELERRFARDANA